MSICIRMPNWIGDAVMATPVLHALRTAFPNTRITAVINADIRKILDSCPDIDRILPFDTSLRRARAIRELFRCAAEIRRERNELAIILPNSFSSALMMCLAGVLRRIGYVRDLRGPLLSHPVARPRDGRGRFKPRYMARHYLKLCEQAGVAGADIRPRLAFAAHDMEKAVSILSEEGVNPDKAFVLIHPYAGYGPSKLWPADRFSLLAQMLHEEFGAQVAFIGSPAASRTVAEIRKTATDTFDLTDCGIDLHLLKCVVGRSMMLVSTDSGPRHYGVASGVPTVCIMGPTDPAYTDSGLPHDAVVRVDVDCGPCQRKTCRTDHRCMNGISAEMVFETCKSMINVNHNPDKPEK